MYKHKHSIKLHLNALYRLTLAAIAKLTITLPSSTKQPSKKALIVPMLLVLLITNPASAGHWGDWYNYFTSKQQNKDDLMTAHNGFDPVMFSRLMREAACHVKHLNIKPIRVEIVKPIHPNLCGTYKVFESKIIIYTGLGAKCDDYSNALAHEFKHVDDIRRHPLNSNFWGSLGSPPAQYLQSPSERSANAYADSGVCQEAK